MSNIKNQIYVKENAVTVGECDNLIKRFHKHEWLLAPGYVGDGEEKQEVKKSTDLTLPWNIVRQHKDFLPFSPISFGILASKPLNETFRSL